MPIKVRVATLGARETAQGFRALGELAEDLTLVPSVRAVHTACNSSSNEALHVCAHIHRHIIKI